MLTKLFVRAQCWVAEDDGATATEYGLLVAFIAFLIIVGATQFGTALGAYFGRLATVVGGWSPAGG